MQNKCKKKNHFLKVVFCFNPNFLRNYSTYFVNASTEYLMSSSLS